MSEDAITSLALVALVWLGWPLHGIAAELRALREMAEKGRR